MMQMELILLLIALKKQANKHYNKYYSWLDLEVV
jgi:hypothetical protein